MREPLLTQIVEEIKALQARAQATDRVDDLLDELLEDRRKLHTFEEEAIRYRKFIDDLRRELGR